MNIRRILFNVKKHTLDKKSANVYHISPFFAYINIFIKNNYSYD